MYWGYIVTVTSIQLFTDHFYHVGFAFCQPFLWIYEWTPVGVDKCSLVSKSDMNGSVIFANANVHPIYKKPKMVAMATSTASLRTSKSAMSSLDSLTPKPTARIKQCVASYHTTEIVAHRKPKCGSIATSLRCRVSAFCRPTTQTPLHNQLPSRCCSHKAS